MKQLQSSLRQPVTVLTTREQWINAGLIGSFVFLFLLFFQPFGVNNYDSSETITLQFFFMMLVMGMYVSIILVFNELVVFRFVFKDIVMRWQLILWILWSVIYSASCVFLLYNALGDWHDFKLSSWLEFIGNFSVMGLLPLAGLWYYAQVKSLKDALTQTNASYHHDDEFTLRFASDNGKEILQLKLKDFLYLESEDNYVAVYHLVGYQTQKQLLRNTIKNIDELALHSALYRCHRSYLVNLYHVRHLKGTTQQGQLQLQHVDSPIPVSKRYVQALRNQLN